MHREVFPDWCQAPAGPAEALVQRVDIWRIPLPESGVDTAAVLSKHTGTAAGRRAAAQRAMRIILGRYLEYPADELPIALDAGGKPYLDTPDRRPEFNLSHSRDIALLAVSPSYAVGIDVETHREIRDPMRIARRVLTRQELADLAGASAEDRMECFLGLWTRMEARQKAIGRGIFARPADPSLLTSFGFRPGPDQYASLCVTTTNDRPELRFFDYRQP
jgi:phosphopantetheine--protein transferase-like protein